jgi:hypothetical protein
MSALGWDRERHRLPALHAPSKYVVVSVDQLYKHLVLTGRQTSHADCIVVTRRFHPTPRQVVDVYVQMPDPWRYVEQPFIIENRPGGGGNIAAEAVVRAPADGYTLLMVSSANAINATLYDKLNFDFIRDIAPIAGINHSTYVLAVHPSFPAKTVNMASAGIGSPPHMASRRAVQDDGRRQLNSRALSWRWGRASRSARRTGTGLLSQHSLIDWVRSSTS